jgi:hypothetical protein
VGAIGLLWVFCDRSRHTDSTEYSRAPSKSEATRKATETTLLFVPLPQGADAAESRLGRGLGGKTKTLLTSHNNTSSPN